MGDICSTNGSANIICAFYKKKIDELFATFDLTKRKELIILLFSKHEDNYDTYTDTDNAYSKFIMNNINLISIDELLNYKLANNTTDNTTANNTDINKCIKYNIITDVLQRKIFMLVCDIIIKKKSMSNINLLIKDWYSYINKLECIKSVDKDKLYDTYKNFYNDVLNNILINKMAKIWFINY